MMEHTGTRVELLLLQQKHEGGREGGPKTKQEHTAAYRCIQVLSERIDFPKTKRLVNGLTVTEWRRKATVSLFMLLLDKRNLICPFVVLLMGHFNH